MTQRPAVNVGPDELAPSPPSYIGRVHRAAEHDPVVGRAFLRVANLVAAPPALVTGAGDVVLPHRGGR